MKNRIITNSLRTIKKSFSRFVPLFFMSFLGVFVFAGLQSLKPDMLVTLDNYMDEHNIYDIKIVSTLGLTADDVNALKLVDGILDIEPTFSKDVIIKDVDNDIVINIETLPQEINTLSLITGRMPEEPKEIIVEDNFIKKTSYRLNDNLEIDNELYKIVGTVDSALYFSNDDLRQERGTTSIGSGTINYYSYVLEDNFNIDYYTGIYITVDKAKEELTSEDGYLKLIEKVTDNIEKIKTDRENERYSSIYNKALAEINKNEINIKKELTRANNKLEQAKKKLDDAKKDLESLNEGLRSFKDGLDTFKSTLDEATSKYNEGLNNCGILESDIELNINTIKNLLENIPVDSEEYINYQNKLNNLTELLNTKNMLNIQKEAYKQKEEEYQVLKETYDIGISEYQKGLNDYNSGLKEYNRNKNNAFKKINAAKKDLKEIKKGTWYISTRNNHETYTSYIDDINSVDNLAQVFPIIFFAVAVMVSLISMNRMVEEDRGEIGTFKSLGFSNGKIIVKYILFSSIATILGGFCGGLLGIVILPNIVFNIYGMLFHVPNFYTGMNFSVIVVSLFISVICICGSTIITALKVLKEKPSELIRPKPPKNGKRIFLENIKFIWNRINFSNKVFLRNMLRYKKRALVAIFGIAGCSALLLCGFGIRDAIVDIANMQYKKTFTYDAMVYLNEPSELKDEDIKDAIGVQNINVKAGNISASLMMVPEDIYKVINFVDGDENNLKLEEGKAIITSKLARLNKLAVGDTIELIDDNNVSYSYEISGIANNYLMHYIYVKADNYKPNVMFLNLNDQVNKEELQSRLKSNENVLNVLLIEDLLKSADDMLKSLNKVVFIVIVLAASLAFVVLYNLSTINIDERKREISTLKVLGFYDKEVDNYITKENIVFTIIGIIFGLIFGYYLTGAVITTVEIEKASFIHHISMYSYMMTSLITIIFTFIVNMFMHHKLKKVDMIASLKSVD